MSESMIERVARALWTTYQNRIGPNPLILWEDATDTAHDLMLAMARDAIQAMREWLDCQGADTDEDAGGQGHVLRMIDAALSESPTLTEMKR